MGLTVAKDTKSWFFQLGWVILFNFIIAILLTILFGSHFWINALFAQCIGLSIFGLQFLCTLIRLFPVTPVGQLSMTVVSIIAGSIAGTVIAVTAIGYDPLSVLRQQSENFIRPVSIGLFFGVVISYFFYSRLRLGEVSHRAKEEQIKRLESEKQLTAAKLKLIQAQIEPHFLFNTLANIGGLIDTNKNAAKQMLDELNTYLRTALERTREGETTLAEEIETVRSYLSIIKVRMQDRLSYGIDVGEELLHYPFPPLLLQPLVENAVKHGLESKTEGGQVRIHAYKNTTDLYIEVSDTGDGLDSHQSRSGLGLSNVNERLKSSFGKNAQLTVREKPNGGVQCLMRIALSEFEQ